MRANVCLCLVSVCLGGCLAARPSAPTNFLHLAGRNFCEAGSACEEDKVFECTARKYAEAAWRTVCNSAPGAVLSPHYHDGFVEGYVDYLDAGGTGDPPAMPPFRYRMHEFQTPEGRQGVRDWFAGFRHGAAVAKASGFRELILVPVSAFPCEPPPVTFYTPPGGQLRDSRQNDLYSVPPTPGPTERLPPPRPVTDPKDEDKSVKVRLILPEPLPIVLQRGGVR